MQTDAVKQPRTVAAAVACAVLLAAQGALWAAPAGFDLDLKELKKPAPVQISSGKRTTSAQQEQSKKTQITEATPAKKKRVKAAARKSAAPAETPQQQPRTAPPELTPQSSHLVVAGETLYGILTRSYGLTGEAANRLLPQVLKLNNLSDTAALSAGQRLLIPLAQPTMTAAAPLPLPPPVAAASTEQSVFLDAASACPLARQTLEALSQPIAATEVLQDLPLAATAAGRYEGIIAVLACELPRAEEYTYRRLLEMQGTRLIVVSADDPLPRAMLAVADGLGISYLRLSDNELLTSPTGGKQLRLRLNKAGR